MKEEEGERKLGFSPGKSGEELKTRKSDFIRCLLKRKSRNDEEND